MMTVRCFPVGQLQANCYVVWDDTRHAAVIDPGDEAGRLWHFLQSEDLTLTAILLTHAHVDHMMGVRGLQARSGAPLLLHAADAPALTDSEKSLTSWFDPTYTLTADRLLADGDTVTVGEERLTVIHTPGHTPGSCCYRWDDLLFTGDTLFAGTVGRTDFPGGSFSVLKQSLARLATLPDTCRILAGHEGESTLGHEKKTNPFMV